MVDTEDGKHDLLLPPVREVVLLSIRCQWSRDFRLRIATHVKPVLTGHFASSLGVSSDGRTIVFAASTLAAPAEIFRVNSDGSGNDCADDDHDAAMRGFGLQKAEEVDWKGALNAPNHGFLIKPANFDASKRYPLIRCYSRRTAGRVVRQLGLSLEPAGLANAGYVVFMPNPRGSTTYGQKFVDEISGDWGGKAFVDIKNGVAEVIKKPYIDKNRIGAAGGSYGGYMVDWILGHNNDPRFKFKALVSHAGVYNVESMATATEEPGSSIGNSRGCPGRTPLSMRNGRRTSSQTISTRRLLSPR
jgi:dipeptidyl aminopeptidase/acylaminoacyl peptidase